MSCKNTSIFSLSYFAWLTTTNFSFWEHVSFLQKLLLEIFLQKLKEPAKVRNVISDCCGCRDLFLQRLWWFVRRSPTHPCHGGAMFVLGHCCEWHQSGTAILMPLCYLTLLFRGESSCSYWCTNSERQEVVGWLWIWLNCLEEHILLFKPFFHKV